jgi:hypothetical protein
MQGSSVVASDATQAEIEEVLCLIESNKAVKLRKVRNKDSHPKIPGGAREKEKGIGNLRRFRPTQPQAPNDRFSSATDAAQRRF